LALVWIASLLGCKERAADAKPDVTPVVAAVPAQPPDAGGAPNKRKAARATHPLPRVKAVSPNVLDLAEGAEFGSPAVALHKGQFLVLDFSAGARVHLIGPCVAEPAVTALDGLLARDCTLSVDLTPSAATPDSGFLLTTPSAGFSLVRSGRFALRSFANGSTVVMVVSGAVSVSAAGAAAAELQRPLSVGDRLEIKLDGTFTRSTHRAATLAQSEQAAAELPERRADPAALSVLDTSLSASSAALRRELLREQELVAAHRAALAADSAQRMELQAQLASQAAVLSRARSRLASALGQRAASRMGTAPGGQDPLSAEAQALLHPSP
jgi:hypothetical protein